MTGFPGKDSPALPSFSVGESWSSRTDPYNQPLATVGYNCQGTNTVTTDGFAPWLSPQNGLTVRMDNASNPNLVDHSFSGLAC